MTKSAMPHVIAAPAQISHSPDRAIRDPFGDGVGVSATFLGAPATSPICLPSAAEEPFPIAPFSGMSFGGDMTAVHRFDPVVTAV
jgi:hypothetical protein